LLFMGVIYIASVIWPQVAPRETHTPWRVRLLGLVGFIPTLFLIFLVLGTIYLGVATPTEASAFGVVGASILAFINRKLSMDMLRDTFLSSARSTAMVMLILTGAFILNSTLAFLGIPQAISQKVASWNLTPMATLLSLIVLYLILGTFMDGFAMMVTTIPVVQPLLKVMNIDLVWFGVISVLLVEAALISPPEGVNLYIIHGVRDSQNKEKTIMDVYKGVMPFFFAMMVAIGLIVVFPEISLWLPNTMKGK